ncbi:MAG: DNA recombination protein RmuC [Pleurocapsa minor HA4230-MV1]|jgi:DNA recombination protein RmuC|nr:DNA recombination protein RmuC [Pleurocapsa minor HA4230-MV1]
MEVLLGLIVGLILGGMFIRLTMRLQIQEIKSQKRASDDKLSFYCSQLETLSAENNDQKQKNQRLEIEIRSTLSKASDAEAKISRLSELQQEVQIKTSEVQSLQSQITVQKEDISRLTADLSNKEQFAKQKIEELNTNLQQVNSESNRYREEIELANQKNAAANAQQEQLAYLRQELEQEKIKNQGLQTEKTNLIAKLSNSDTEAKISRLSELQQELQIKTSEVQSLQSQITVQKEDISRLTANLSNKEQSAKQKIEDLNTNLQQVNSENNRYREEIELANQKNAAANAQQEQLAYLRQELEQEKIKNQEFQAEKNDLIAKLSNLESQLDLLENLEQKFTSTFELLSSKALQHNNQQFIEVAKETFANIHQSSHNRLDNLVSPLNSSLEAFNKQIKEIENSRQEDKGKISEQLQSVVNAQYQLQTETANLSKALRQPVVRGIWGEMQLKRVVELSGMQEHCDFTIQETVHTEDGSPSRPDLIVKLPGKKQVIVDSKTPLKAYLEAIEAKEESIQLACLKNHAGHIRTHINQLSSKNYWEQFNQTPEFVIMFLPGEVFFSAALQQDPRLIEFGIEKKVILATPTTLITLLKTIEYGWRQERVAENAQAIGNLGRELYDRFIKFTQHLNTVRKKLDDTVKAYNTTIGSYESRLLVTARKFQEIGGYGNDEVESIKIIDRSIQLITQEYNLENDK